MLLVLGSLFLMDLLFLMVCTIHMLPLFSRRTSLRRL